MNKRRLESKLLAIFKALMISLSIYCLIFTGHIVASSGIKSSLSSSPMATQKQAGDKNTQAVSSIPDLVRVNKDSKIAILYIDQQVSDGTKYFMYYWASYWLYPANAYVSSDSEILKSSQYDAILVLFPPNLDQNIESYNLGTLNNYSKTVINTQAILLVKKGIK